MIVNEIKQHFKQTCQKNKAIKNLKKNNESLIFKVKKQLFVFQLF